MHPLNPARHDAYIGIGSNLGQRIEYLQLACTSLQALGLRRCSPVYETTPVGYVDQPNFLNMVVHLQTDLSARQLLAALHDIEQQARRERQIRFGPRTLDLDILLYDDEYLCFADLQIPHPRMWTRSFVLVPLADLIGSRKGLGGNSIRAMAHQLSQKDEVRYVGRFW